MEAIELEKLSIVNYDANLCLTCSSCVNGCPAAGIDGLDPRKAIRMYVLGLEEELVNSKWPWVCTLCGRCAYACPMNIDLPGIFKYIRSLRPREKVPGVLHKGVINVLETGNNLRIPKDDYLMLMEELGEELANECCPGFRVPIDVVGAEYLFFPNSKEVFGEPDDMKWWWKIFYAAKVSWTIPSENWESVDWGSFTADDEASKKIAKFKVDNAKKLKVRYIIAPDCGGSSWGFRYNYEKYFKDEMKKAGIELVYIYDVLIRFIKEGLIKIDKSKHPQLTTYHDPCKHGRILEMNNLKPYYEEPRFIIKQCCENFVEMYPNRGNNFCCGAGSGAWAGPYEKERVYYGRMKAEQIRNTRAKLVITSCSNCRDQIMKSLKKEYNLDIEVKYIWQLVADSLII